MKIRYFNGDMDLVMVEGAEAVATIAMEKLNLFMGEWFKDTEAGIPWMSVVGQKMTQSTVNFIATYVANELSSIPEVTNVEVTDFTLDSQTRKLTLKLTVNYQGESLELEQTYGV